MEQLSPKPDASDKKEASKTVLPELACRGSESW
jgi:hypothetical protein